MTGDEPHESPTSVVWLRQAGLSARARRELDRLVEVATDIADRDGLDALTMRRLATAAETGTTTLYRYVHNRDELLDLMADAAHATLAVLNLPSGAWRADTTRIAHALRELYLRHPWLPTLFVTVGPHTLRLADRIAATTLAVTADPAVADAVNNALLSYVRGAVLAEVMERAGEARPGHAGPEEAAARTEWQLAVITGGQYPAFVRIATAARRHHDHASRFDFGLARLLDGLDGFLQGE